ncbi:MAG: hypothetical protein ABI361_04560 [Nitrososphaera sp.]|jgi:hypothetical protein
MTSRKGSDTPRDAKENGKTSSPAGLRSTDPFKNPDPSLTVFVKSAEGSEIASKLSGYFVLRGVEFRFKAIAFGRIGGHNASVTLSKKTTEEIKKMGLDVDDIYLLIQRKLIEGDVILPDGLRPPE